MNRRAFGLLVRLLAVLAAIYALFTLRSQLPNEEPARGPIPIKVVSKKQTPCGWISVRSIPATERTSSKELLEQNPVIAEAILAGGKLVPVRDPAECERLVKLNNSVFSNGKGNYRIQFKK